MVKKTRNIKRSKHDQIVNDYDKIKEKHLEKLANKILKDDEKKEQLKKYNIKGDFLNNL
jgi:DNA-directed RNA polymerase subunit H (RpoH/RPB5)|tara:strand:- start:89 stop:265 length:177 start_codon:yes stop_codon:yes gene_type:complete